MAQRLRGKKIAILATHGYEQSGTQWRDADVVVDGNIVTSRRPDGIPAISEAAAKALEA